MATFACKLTTLTGLYRHRYLKLDLFFKAQTASARESSTVSESAKVSSTNSASTDVQEDAATIFAKMEAAEEEEKIEALRDISCLSPVLKRRIHGQIPEIRNDYQETLKYQRKLYAKFGKASGVDPRIMWPTKEEASERVELIKEWEPSLEKLMANLKAKKEADAKFIADREKKIEANMAKMNQWIAEYRQKKNKKDADVKAKEAKNQQLIEEAREFFGYYVDPRDTKFQEMVEEKEKQEKAKAKQIKKEKRMEKLTARLQAMTKESESSS